MFKMCLGCGKMIELNAEHFPIKHTTKDGFGARCRPCTNELARENYRKNHKERVIKKRIAFKKRWSEHREEINKRRQELYSSEMNVRRQWNSEYYRQRSNEIIKKHREYNNTDRGKAVKHMSAQRRRMKCKSLPVNFSEKDWNKCKDYFDNKCCYCGNEAILTKDHFIALKNGGEFTLNNILPSCKSCNSKKRQFDFFNWYPRQKFYSIERESKILKYLNYNKKTKTQQLALL